MNAMMSFKNYGDRRAGILLFLLIFAMLLSGCVKNPSHVLKDAPSSVFEPEPEDDSPVTTVGELADSYVRNLTALRRANNKLGTLCVLAGQCKETTE